MIKPSILTKICLECGEPLIGRADKKFCNDQCRVTHYQKQQGDAIPFIRNINNQLRKNRLILAKLNPDGKSKVKRSNLEKEGFNFKLFTSTYTTRDGRVYYFVYDYGYLPLENDYFALVQNSDI
ncbi:MAG: hypothetical protein CVT92_15160 [Bacteroidetes bacterium HGW-Bacteroidetes-1]|jgi:predicted nucleic acid-binding Zn ribbon protein|nr:MAG: hypothetical protein CVT92_15160 [Bacteroidetes bacterium HGW-Bacteroidetes-1]